MPSPVPSWVTQTPLTAKSLVLAAYTCDGSLDHPNGVAFHTFRPLLAEVYNRAATLATSTGGTQTVLSTSGATTGGLIAVDTAGYFGMTQDQPGTGYYQFTSAVKGSAGDGVTAGGWTLVSHFAAVAEVATQVSVSADLLGTGQPTVTGTRQPTTAYDCVAFFLDLVNAGPGVTWQPAVTVRDTAAAAAATVVTPDGSGETCRLCAIWAAVTASVNGQAVYNVAGTYPFTVPAGVTSLSVAAFGGGGPGGAGNSSTGGAEFGGGGGGGGEYASGSIAVTPGNNYSVITGSGATGGNSQVAGDSANVTAHGGTAGAAATTLASGAGGAGGTGSTNTTHYSGGAGAAGTAGTYGGGGGSSGGTGQAGANATTAAGAPAPPGGGPGGAGGAAAITVVQTGHGTITGTNTLTVKMKSAFQAGSTVLTFVYYQGDSPTTDPTVALSDGTVLALEVNADVASNVSLQVGLFDTYNITGGQTGVTINCHGTGNSVKAILAEVYEVAGLGPSPSIDVSSAHTQGPASPDKNYQSFASSTGAPATTKAPDLWVAMTGAQYTSPFFVASPAASQGWGGLAARYASNGGIYGALLTGRQVRTATGTLAFSGTFSRGVTKGTLAAAYFTSTPTPGAAPVTGPGGGGGAGLGAGNAGGAGGDGQVTLTWAGPPGGGYGTPQLPAPYSTWADTTSIGTNPAATVNLNSPAGVRDVLNFLSTPPVLRVSTTSGQSIPATTLTGVTFAAAPTVDSYAGWNPATSAYTVQRAGLYLFHGLACFSASGAANRAAAVTVNGTSYWGPPSPAASAGTTNVAKTQMLDLQAGDTVSFACYQGTAAALALDTGAQTRFLLVYLCQTGAPAGPWPVPDVTFRWAAGTQPTAGGGNLTALLQTHLASDLGFLANRPYFTAYQSTAQTGLAASAFSTVTLDQAQGVIHATTGDNYTGWAAGTANAYTAQVPGWYLLAGEFFATNPASAGPTVIAGIKPSTSGGITPAHPVDYYQQLAATISSGLGGGAAVFGLQYLQTGETVTPMINGNGYAASYGTLTGAHTGATFGSHLSGVWLSG